MRIMRILLVEDDRILGASLQRAIEKRGYGIDWLQDGESAVLALNDAEYHLFIFDINLPKLSGLELLKRLRGMKNDAPVMMLTARDTPLQKVEGLDSGADDYLVKPFDLEELIARIRALLRRTGARLTNTILTCGAVELDPAASVVKNNGAPVTVTAREFRLLKLLMERADKYITKNDIEYALYDAESMAESNTIEVTIYNLRKKLGTDFIKSLRGIGYIVNS